MQGGVCGVGRGRRGLGTWGGARLGRLGEGGDGGREGANGRWGLAKQLGRYELRGYQNGEKEDEEGIEEVGLVDCALG